MKQKALSYLELIDPTPERFRVSDSNSVPTDAITM